MATIHSPQPEAPRPPGAKKGRKRRLGTKKKNCLHCGKRFMQSQVHQRFCSAKCRVVHWHEDKALQLATKLMKDALENLKGRDQ